MNNNWISVEECLPEKGINVLVVDMKFGRKNPTIYIGGIDEDSGEWYIITDGGIILNYEKVNYNYQWITHWMNLPELPLVLK